VVIVGDSGSWGIVMAGSVGISIAGNSGSVGVWIVGAAGSVGAWIVGAAGNVGGVGAVSVGAVSVGVSTVGAAAAAGISGSACISGMGGIVISGIAGIGGIGGIGGIVISGIAGIAGIGGSGGSPGASAPDAFCPSSSGNADEVCPVRSAELSSVELAHPPSMRPRDTPTMSSETRVMESMSSYLLIGPVLHAEGRHDVKEVLWVWLRSIEHRPERRFDLTHAHRPGATSMRVHVDCSHIASTADAHFGWNATRP
jgi:hypothetical protein